MKPDIQKAFAAIEAPERAVLLAVRDLILDCAGDTPVEECLRWGQPSYIAAKGSALRLGVSKAGRPAIYAHCQSNIVSVFAAQSGEAYDIEGNRAVYLDGADPEGLRPLIHHALTYKIR